MSLHSISLECPGCGAPISADMLHCVRCMRPVVVTSFNHMYGMTSKETKDYITKCKKTLAEDSDNEKVELYVGMSHLRLKMYDKAYAVFDQLIDEDFEDSENYFYAAVCLLKGKRAFLTQLSNIKKIQQYLDAAIMIEERGVYHLFLAYIKLDYYAKKALRVSPSWQEEFMLARKNHLSAEDTRILFEMLNVPIPAEFSFV